MGDKLLLVFALVLSTVNCQSTVMFATSEGEKSSSVDEARASSPDNMQSFEPNGQVMVIEPESGGNKGNADEANVNSDDNSQIVLLKDLFDVLEAASSDRNETTDQNDDTGVKIFTENIEEPIDALGSDNIEVRSQSGASESTRSNTPTATFIETKEMNEGPRFASTPFESMSEQLLNAASTPENSPVLQLTQGGYQRPYQQPAEFTSLPQKLTTESATQQTEAVESPNKNVNNGERLGRAQIPLPTPFFPSPFQFNSNPAMSNPFASSMNVMRTPNGAFQNSFYNTQPDVSQRQYSQLVNPGEFPGVRFTVQTAPRNPMQNFGLFQNPFQFPLSQPSANAPGQMPGLFPQNGSPAYSNFDSELDSPAADFASLFSSIPATAQFQENSNPYGSNQNFGRNIYSSPNINPLAEFANIDNGAQFSPRLLNYPMPNNQPETENRNNEQQLPEISSALFTEKQGERVDEVPKDDIAVPFGTRIQKQNEGQNQNDFKRQDNVYIRYPITEAGYATEENLPAQNNTEKKSNINNNEIPLRDAFPFFSVPRRYNVFDGPDPYKIALENVKREYPSSINTNVDNKTNTEGSESESMALAPGPNPLGAAEIMGSYPERNTGLQIQDAPFYAEPEENPFQPIALFPGNTYPFAPRPIRMNEYNKTPTCAQSTNASLCFDDPEYPRGEMLYALNSNPIIMDRLAMPDQQLEDIPLVEQNKTENPISEDNYICKSDIKNGLPLRARNVRGNWKVIVNMKGSIGRRKFVQPVRLEVCRGAGEPCSFTQVQTACVQKYNLQRLLSWSMEKGIHIDVYKLPVACSCQLLEEKV